MANNISKKHPEKSSDCCRPAGETGGEKPCMMDEVFDENFDLRAPPEGKNAGKPDDRKGARA